MHRLDKVRNFALRVLSGKRKFDHISGVRDELGWLTAHQMYQHDALNLIHKIRCTIEPQTFGSLLQVNSRVLSRSTRQDAAPALPRGKTEAGKRRIFLPGGKAVYPASRGP